MADLVCQNPLCCRLPDGGQRDTDGGQVHHPQHSLQPQGPDQVRKSETFDFLSALTYRRETFITNELMIRSEDLSQEYDDDEESQLDVESVNC